MQQLVFRKRRRAAAAHAAFAQRSCHRVLSLQAYHAFTPEQRRVLRRHVAELHHAPIDTLEHVGGGGVRCALGEVFT